jgi:mono/diheme cytochrome c family protein
MAAGAMAGEAPPAFAPETAPASHALKSVSEFDSRKLEADPEKLPGAAVFQEHCAQCHQGQVPKAPQKMFLQMMSGSTIHEALASGLMKSQAQSLTEQQRVQVAEYLSGGPLSAATNRPRPKMCVGPAREFDAAEAPLRAECVSETASGLPRSDIRRGNAATPAWLRRGGQPQRAS